MKDYIVTVSSHRATKDGRFNVFGGQSIVRKEFDNLSSAKKFAYSAADNARQGKVPTGLKTTDKTAFVEIIGNQPYDGTSSRFCDARLSYKNKKSKKTKKI